VGIKPAGKIKSAGKIKTALKADANLNRDKAAAGIRLNRFIAMHTGVSRRNADDIIKEERVLINGKKVKNLATAVKEGDEVFPLTAKKSNIKKSLKFILC
jgi:16S rRNA uridine-516 pseudouridylate synthase and related pseudouridylate synthases